MSRELSPPPGISIQDDTARRIRDGIVNVYKQLKKGTVWSNVRWQPDRGLPDSIYPFDLLICEPTNSYSEDGSETILEPTAKVITSIDIVRPERFESDWHDKPDHLEVCRLYEYCLFDPTGDFMRPRLQVWRKSDGRWCRVRTASHGVFFSSCGFCLDTRLHDVQVRRCGRSSDEESLFFARIEYAKSEGDRRNELEAKVRKLEQRVANPRSRPSEMEEGE